MDTAGWQARLTNRTGGGNMQQTSLYDRGDYYARLGYHPIPIARGQKACFVAGWQTNPWKQTFADAPPVKYAGIGVLANLHPAADIDVYNEAMVKHLRDWCFEHIGPTPERVGQPPKLLLPYRTEEPFAKIVSARYKAPGSDKVSKIEILGDGQQWVAEAIHPDTKKPYGWSAPLPPSSELPVITKELALALCAEFEAMADMMGWEKVGDREEGTKYERRPDPILDALQERGLLKKEHAGKPGTWDIACPWEHEHSPGVGEKTGTAYMQAHFGGRDHAAFKCHHASCEGRHLTDVEVELGIAPSLGEMFGPIGVTGQGAGELFSDLITNLEAPFMLIEDMLTRGDLNALLGQPGGGKTAVGLDTSLHLSAGIKIGNKRVARQRVLYIGAEAPQGVKVKMRMWCERNNVDPKELDGWFHFVGMPLDMGNPAVVRALLAKYHPDKWHGRPLGLVVIDTFSACYFGDNENDSAKVMPWYNNVRVEIILKTGAAVLVMHHPPKGAAEWEELHNLRGAGAAKATLDNTWAVRREDDVVTLNNVFGKARMQPFDDMQWRMVKVPVDGLINNFGVQVSTQIGVLMMEDEQAHAYAPKWNDNDITALDGIAKDKYTNAAKVARSSGKSFNSIDRAIKRLKKDGHVGERSGTLYLKNSGTAMLEKAKEEGWAPMVQQVFGEVENPEQLPKK